MAVNTMKVGYSVQDVCQILHYSVATVHRLINEKEIECLITDAKTPGGRRQFRFLKEHIQHYMLKHYDRFDDVTLSTWGVMTTPKKYVANASTPRIPIDAFSKPVEDTPTRPSNPNMDRITPAQWAGKSLSPEKKPYLRTPEVKAAEKAAEVERQRTVQSRPQENRMMTTKKFPGFKIVLNGTDVVAGVEPATAGKIVEALMSDRNLRVTELTISYDGAIEKEVPNRE